MARRGGPLARVLVAAVGVGAWTLTEYVAHRWVMHGSRRWGPVSREHRIHHADPEATDPRLRALGYAAVITPAVAGAAAAGAWPLGVGWAAGYAAYEQFHWREHHRPPLGPWERDARRRHFAHHFGAPRTNYGVTTALWDHVFGTFRPPVAVRVPAQQAMPWLLAGDGTVRGRFADDYVLVGTRHSHPAAASDTRAASAARSPRLPPGHSRGKSAGAYDGRP